jgi:tetratricopeptide (TPR) repeat protein
MTLSDAFQILGLGPDEDPRLNLEEFKNARERIAEQVRMAPNETLALRYQTNLVQFDQALAAIREHLEIQNRIDRSGPLPAQITPTEPPSAESVFEPVFEPAEENEPVSEKAPESTETIQTTETARSSHRGLAFVSFLIFAAAVGGAIYYLNPHPSPRSSRPAVDLTPLEKQGAALIENRRWPEATRIYDQLEQLAPDSPEVANGRKKIAAGMVEEQTQFVGYWTGQARASYEAGRWDEAESAALQVLAKFPNEKEAASLLPMIASGRLAESHRQTLETGRAHLDQRQWQLAIESANQVLANDPTDEQAKTLLATAIAAQKQAEEHLAKARELLAKAVAKDSGKFDEEILAWAREAAALAPDDAEIAAYLEKISSYSRTIHVPGDFATPAEAFAQARDRDRIVLASGLWKGPLMVDSAIDLQAGDHEKPTIIECSAETGSAITFGPHAKGARVTGLTFRHESFDAGAERFSTALIRGGKVDFVDCGFVHASGHGLAVIEGGRATVTRCRFTDNGWDGIAASGTGSFLDVRDSQCLRNFGHGIEAWDGAAMTLTNNRCEENSRNGIHADTGDGLVTVLKNQLIANREFGLVVSSTGSGKISENLSRANLLGGFVIRTGSGAIDFSENQATHNEGPGLVLEKGLAEAAYASNSFSENAGQQIMTDADLSPPEEILPQVQPAPEPIPEPAKSAPPRAIPVPDPQ